MDVMDALDEVMPLALEHRMSTEDGRQLAPPLVEAIVAHRLCLLPLPSSLGGWELPLVDFLQVLERLARVEASLPWFVWNNAQVCFFSRFLAPDTRARLFADPSALFAISAIPAGTARATEVGYRVSGRWPLVSGCQLADWLLLNCRVDDPDGQGAPGTDYVVVSSERAQIVDTWHTGGMRGTGSHDVVVDDVVVERSASLLWSPFPPPTDTAVERVPISASLVAGLAAQMIGIAAAAVDAVTVRAREHVTDGPAPDLRDRARAQEAVGRHGAAVDAARSRLHECSEHVWRLAADRTDCPIADVADMYGAALHAMDVAPAAVDAMCATAGTWSIYTSSPLERAARDIQVMRRHRLAGTPLVEDVGRVRFGLDPVDPLFAV